VSAILNRREFAQAAAGLGLWATVLNGAAQRVRNIRIGHTGITWPNNQIDQAIRDIAGLGFHGLETFGNVLETWESKGGLGPVLEQNKLPLLSAYCTANLTEPARRNLPASSIASEPRSREIFFCPRTWLRARTGSSNRWCALIF